MRRGPKLSRPAGLERRGGCDAMGRTRGRGRGREVWSRKAYVLARDTPMYLIPLEGVFFVSLTFVCAFVGRCGTEGSAEEGCWVLVVDVLVVVVRLRPASMMTTPAAADANPPMKRRMGVYGGLASSESSFKVRSAVAPPVRLLKKGARRGKIDPPSLHTQWGGEENARVRRTARETSTTC